MLYVLIISNYSTIVIFVLFKAWLLVVLKGTLTFLCYLTTSLSVKQKNTLSATFETFFILNLKVSL